MKKYKVRLLGTSVLVTAMAMFSTPTVAQDTADSLRQQVDALSQRVEELEGRSVLTGRTPGLKLTFGGYAKADFIYDLDQDTGDLFVPEAIDVDGLDDQRFTAHARQSRLFFTAQGDAFKAHIEGDFFGVGGNQVFSNSASFRLRHAYGEFNAGSGKVLAGQFWTNFMPIAYYPSTVDFNGPAGIPFIRQAQLRYTWTPSDRLTLSASLENSEFSGRDAAGNIVGETTGSGLQAGLDGVPDLTFAGDYSADTWGLRAAVVLRELNSPDGSDSETGYGVNIAGRTDLWEGGSFVGSVTYGDGIGRYLINGFGQDAFIDAGGDVNTIEAFGLTAQVNHKFTNKLTGALAYGLYDVSDTFAPDDLEQVQTLHATMFYKPTDRVTLGAEAIFGERENADGASRSITRLQTSVQFSF